MSGSQQLLLGEGAGGSGPPVYIEDVFSTYLYTGTGAAQTIVNGIDLSTKGGLVWQKSRTAAQFNGLVDTVRGVASCLVSSSTGAVNTVAATGISAFNSNGFTQNTNGDFNTSTYKYVSWTFRKQPKFFDVQTATSSGGIVTFNHNLGVAPGMVIIKGTNGTDNWMTYHISLGVNNYIFLNSDSAAGAYSGLFTSSSTQFSLNSLSSPTQYVAYLFASNAGGFGLTSTDNVVSCGSYTGTGSAFDVNLGYEAQWVMIKRSTGGTGEWAIFDIMRGMTAGATDVWLYPNTSDAEQTGADQVNPTATGFRITSTGSRLNDNGSNYIYIAIRRGPMAVPTVGTSVFSPQVQTPPGGTSTMAASSGFPIDWLPTKQKDVVSDWYQTSRLTNGYMSPNTTAAENAFQYGFDLMQGVSAPWSTNSTVSYSFRRASSFFDMVCYTGTGSATTVTHNLTVAPELMFVKARSGTGPWNTYVAPLGPTIALYLETTGSVDVTGRWNSTTPTSTVFSVSSNADVNGSGTTYVAYLFATCAGVSKVGSYTGDGTNGRVVNCSFTTGARFVLIKKSSNISGWAVWDSARGIVAGNDPYLLVNSTSAEQTAYDDIDTDSTGFAVNSSGAGFPTNDSGVTYIFLAIA